MARIRKAVIPAAGLGTRLYPLTRVQPKEMLPIVDRPVIHYVVKLAVDAGLDQILMIVGATKNAIIDYFDKSKLDEKFEDNELKAFPDIYFVRQKELKGLADAVRYAEGFVGNEPFVLLLGDTLYVSEGENVVSQLLRVYEEMRSTLVMVEEVEWEEVSRYGVIKGKKLRENLWKVEHMVEKPRREDAPSNLAITGAYILTPKIFRYIERISPGAGGEYQLTDALALQCKDETVLAYKFQGKRYDTGTLEGWLKTFVEFAKRDKRFSTLFGY
ncbi:hypothetical protein B9Q11_05115 [Candidatus Marsarchaeota G2 archaeon ECH_B_SAG-F08]|jgi:UTP--glucose-1-phosphate uridylyltransferase|uniref:UTP--glucose-1-phosphate uridylyltransferase n=4 Tax=Candidatus Marsarchaeota TaxID=1978152 RepID=A0A2R6AHM4_9ARCH|nr:MAG: hypothetical protein B9Q01_04900 [Candidatus Marsarchaeota G1 archaeon OSP_D]PSN85886.1 MAG: hypothetical protein B9Q02_04550 [Candidatus Marsarchaeota G1 archaeon BE_D]PSN88210.1 MAG: hypothetical protein B9Q00_06440 [Candidatus Marsarchaeota G1 archaeon OSP_C]PSN97005.1 MAG: hypothetical protein B9Q11_05115 [Candidatus Marsarchaeota G2 archaeon ECH_B_SAG-F08]